MSDYDYLMDLITTGDLTKLEEASQISPGFPSGKDDFVGRHWITNIIDCGNFKTLQWALGKRVDLHFRDEEGYTPLHSAIDKSDDGLLFVRTLIEHGADINARGKNDWTPLHQAAALDKLAIVEYLVEAGADLYARTNIDNHATPLEEARSLGCHQSVKFLAPLYKS